MFLSFLDEGGGYLSLENILSEPDSKVTSYGGEIVSVRRTLVRDLVLPAWPEKGEACLSPVEEFVTRELRDDLLNPERCLLPKEEWPKVPPRSRAHASDSEWYALVQEGVGRNIFGEVTYKRCLRTLMGTLC